MQKRGISLIVLVITIIVMIILAAAIIISLNNTGIISNANKAVEDTNLKQLQEMSQVAWLEGVNARKTGDELKNYVLDSLKKNGFSDILDKYKIEVTDEEVKVSIKQSGVPLESISLNKSKLVFFSERSTDEVFTYQLNVIYNPENTDVDKTVTWKSSNERVTVDNTGKITTTNYGGSATITATVGDKTATCDVECLNTITLLSGDVYTLDGEYFQVSNAESLQPYVSSLINEGEYTGEELSLVQKIEDYSFVGLAKLKFGDNTDYVEHLVAGIKGIASDDRIIVKAYINGSWEDIEAEPVADATIMMSFKGNTFPNPVLIEILKLQK